MHRSHYLLVAFTLFAIALSVGCGNRSRRDRRVDGAILPMRDGGVVMTDGGPETDGGGTCEGTMCGEECVLDLGNDDRHCGECFNACDVGEECSDATCWPIEEMCPAGREMCDGVCVDLSTNAAHCGGCFEACPTGSFCVDGFCEETCTPSCSGVECGSDGCGGSCGTCGMGTTCIDGYCELDCTPSCAGLECGSDGCGGSCGSCGSGETCSSGTCVGTTTGGGERCSSATSISSFGGSQTFTFTGRVSDHTPFSCGTSSARPDVAFSFRPSTSGTVTVTAAAPGTEIDTMLAVFSSSLCSSSYEVACNDDDPAGGLDSYLTFSATAFTTYYIVVAPYSSTTPTGTVQVTVTAP